MISLNQFLFFFLPPQTNSWFLPLLFSQIRDRGYQEHQPIREENESHHAHFVWEPNVVSQESPKIGKQRNAKPSQVKYRLAARSEILTPSAGKKRLPPLIASTIE